MNTTQIRQTKSELEEVFFSGSLSRDELAQYRGEIIRLGALVATILGSKY